MRGARGNPVVQVPSNQYVWCETGYHTHSSLLHIKLDAMRFIFIAGVSHTCIIIACRPHTYFILLQVGLNKYRLSWLNIFEVAGRSLYVCTMPTIRPTVPTIYIIVPTICSHTCKGMAYRSITVKPVMIKYLCKLFVYSEA